MANKEHVRLIKQGNAAWNNWRRKHIHNILPELSGAILKEEDLSGANLSRADLSGANLSLAILSGANLSLAILSGANLSLAILSGANLSGVVNLSRVNLSSTDLSGRNFSGRDLRGANLSLAILSGAKLRGANLSRADLSGANLSKVNLSETHLDSANLSEADLRRCNLIDANLDGAILTGTKLWEAQRDGWSIKNVLCEYAFWDREGKNPTYYAPEEFERLHKEGLEIEIQYKGGISRMEILTLPMLLQYLETKYKGCALRLKSIEDAPGGAKARIVIDETGDAQPKQLQAALNKQTQELQKIQRALGEERKLRAELEDQSKRFKSQVEILRDTVISAMRASTPNTLINIENIKNVGVIGNFSDKAHALVDQSTKSTPDDSSSD